MPQSTPLDSLDGEPTADEERVNRILAEMKGSPDMPRIISEAPVSTSIADTRMDPRAARAHVIGNSTPSMADFQSMLFQTPPGMTPIHRQNEEEVQIRREVKATPPPASMWSVLVQQIRAPIVVAVIIFFLNLPIITTVMSRYASWMYLGSGEISISGLLVKSVLGAALFTAYQLLSNIFT